MKKLFNYTWAALALCTLAACSDDSTVGNGGKSPIDPNAGKEVIAFSPQGNGVTRAVTPAAFGKDTKVVMRIKAQNGSNTTKADYRYTQAILTAGAKVTGDSCNTVWGLNGEHSHLSYKNYESTEASLNNTRYWDDAFGHQSKLTVYAVAIPNLAAPAQLGDDILNQASDNITAVDASTNPYWYTMKESAEENTKITWTLPKIQNGDTFLAYDLAYSNNIRSDVGATDVNLKGRYHQTWNEVDSKWDPSMTWGRMEWVPQAAGSTVGKFDQGHLVFQHALTYIEINLKEGAGFNSTSASDFKFTGLNSGSSQSIRLKKFPITGQLDLSKGLNSTGMWTPTAPTDGTDDIIQMKETRQIDGSSIKLEGYVIPGTQLSTVTDNLIVFEIDDTKYYVTGNEIATAITSADASKTAEANKTLAGKHYVINLKVGKTAISQITAAILPWEDVNTTDFSADNTHFHFAFEDRGDKLDGTMGGRFDLYRSARPTDFFIDNVTSDGTSATTAETAYDYTWGTGYTSERLVEGNKKDVPNRADKTCATGTTVWGTNWYWENNKTWYHFRAAGIGESPKNGEGDTIVVVKDATNGDYFEIANGPVDGNTTYNDWVWGAPFKQYGGSYKFWYDSADGFSLENDNTTRQIAPAIGSTKDVINMLLFHVTSQIIVNLTTTTDADAVVLCDDKGTADTSDDVNSTVKIVRFLPSGLVRMGTGKVEASGTRDTGTGVTMTTGSYNGTASPKTFTNFTWGMVPQPLSYANGTATEYVGLEITTPDGNTYYVRDLSSLTAKVSESSLKETHLKNPYTKATGSETYYVINEWYPHYRYTYNITLKKKGILDITAAILPWEIVNGNNINIDLEN